MQVFVLCDVVFSMNLQGLSALIGANGRPGWGQRAGNRLWCFFFRLWCVGAQFNLNALIRSLFQSEFLVIICQGKGCKHQFNLKPFCSLLWRCPCLCFCLFLLFWMDNKILQDRRWCSMCSQNLHGQERLWSLASLTSRLVSCDQFLSWTLIDPLS